MFRLLMLAGVLSVANLLAGGAPPASQPLSGTDQAMYLQLLQAEVNKAQELAAQIAKESDGVSHDPGDYMMHRAALQEAETMFRVKEGLVQSFWEDSSIDSPVVREELYKLLKQETITIQDIKTFKKKVQNAEAQMAKEKREEGG